MTPEMRPETKKLDDNRSICSWNCVITEKICKIVSSDLFNWPSKRCSGNIYTVVDEVELAAKEETKVPCSCVYMLSFFVFTDDHVSRR